MSRGYKLYHPRWHRRRIPIFWWLGKWSYTKFISRELTSLAVVWTALVLVAQIWALGRGPEAWARLNGILAHPAAVGVHFVVALGLLFHTVTWLNLAPKALVLRLAGRKVPNGLVLTGHYLAWIGISGGLLWGLLG